MLQAELAELRARPVDAGDPAAQAAIADLTAQMAALEAASAEARTALERQLVERDRELERIRMDLEIARLGPPGGGEEDARLAELERRRAAEAAAREAAETARVRRSAYDVAAAKWADYDAKAREGLVPLSDALDARGAMDLAQVALVQSRYQEKIAVANLELAMGLTLVPEQKSEPKAEK